MRVLAINSGSSSVKIDGIDVDLRLPFFSIRLERLDSGEAELSLSFPGLEERRTLPGARTQVLEAVLSELPSLLEDTGLLEETGVLKNQQAETAAFQAVVHRVVHGGERFQSAVRLDEDVLSELEGLSSLAPIHNPRNLEGIRTAQRVFPEVPHFAVFDTAFHATLPRRAKSYALPQAFTKKYGIRRFGFHGSSHQFVAGRAAAFLGTELRALRIISLHLGSGCSAAAIEYGNSVETSMGFTPLEGLVMGTRCGDVDAGILFHLLEQNECEVAELEDICQKQSGLLGLSGISSDLRDILSEAEKGDSDAQLAIQVFCHRARKYVGAYAAVMGGVDAIVFTGGIGENAASIRQRIAQRLDFLGAVLDEDRNTSASLSLEHDVAELSASVSRVKILAVRTDEQLAMALEAADLHRRESRKLGVGEIPIGVSARHVHLTQAAVEHLFGAGHTLSVHKELHQPGQFAAKETLTLVGPRNRIEGVRVLGPTRKANQVEISRTDEFHLGIDAPVRESGNLSGTPGIRLEGPAGSLELAEGVICAWRHIHMSPEDAEAFEVRDGDMVDVAVEQESRRLSFGSVLIRVSPHFALEMHVDTDEANAAEVVSGLHAKILSKQP